MIVKPLKIFGAKIIGTFFRRDKTLGKEGKTPLVFYEKQGRCHAAKRPVPRNPRTLSQQDRRDLFGYADFLWNSLTEWDKKRLGVWHKTDPFHPDHQEWTLFVFFKFLVLRRWMHHIPFIFTSPEVAKWIAQGQAHPIQPPPRKADIILILNLTDPETISKLSIKPTLSISDTETISKLTINTKLTIKEV